MCLFLLELVGLCSSLVWLLLCFLCVVVVVVFVLVFAVVIAVVVVVVLVVVVVVCCCGGRAGRLVGVLVGALGFGFGVWGLHLWV